MMTNAICTIAVLHAVLLAANLTSCAMLADPATIDGVVVQTKTHEPISGAYMIFQWSHERPSMFEGKGEECDHVEVAQTDANGHYSAKAYHGDKNPKYWYVYKPGYHQSMDPADGYSDQTDLVGLKAIPNDTEAREIEFFRLLNIRCSVSDDPGDPALLRVYDQMYAEEMALPNRNPKASLAVSICEERGEWQYGLAPWMKMEKGGMLCH